MRRRWLAVIGVVGGVALAVAGLIGFKAWEAERLRRDPIARREKVFDAVWSTVDRNYYAPDFDHERWRQIRDVFRPAVKTVDHDVELYMNILGVMLNAVGTSHLSVGMPPAPPPPPQASVGSRAPDAPSPKAFGCGGYYFRFDLGFEYVEVRRGPVVKMVILDVERGGAAEKAGVAPGEIIQAFTSRRGKDGCPHTRLVLASEGTPPRVVEFDVEDRPARPPLQRVDLPSGVRVLRFDGFNRDALKWLDQNLAAPPPKGVVLDLRRNGGGKVWVNNRVAGDFLPPGSALGSSVTRNGERPERSRSSKVRYEGPLVVLIGPGSASAAEITASVLRYHRRALLVGGETAGAVLTSRRYRLPDGGQVSVAIADHRTPDGKRLEGVGVKPDWPVAQTLAAVRAGRDLPLEAAERAILTNAWRP